MRNCHTSPGRSSPPRLAKDIEANVRSDELGHFHGASDPSNQDYRSFTAKPPAQRLRRVVVWDEANQKNVVLLTDLLDVPAYVIAAIYRQRWQVELFFKWLKTYANFDHLLSHHPHGVTSQFYVAVIATLLLHLATGRRVSKYALFWLGSVATGQATFAQMQAGLARIEREKELERARKRRAAERKKLGQSISGPFHGDFSPGLDAAPNATPQRIGKPHQHRNRREYSAVANPKE